jgi:hypothetical protein
MGESNEMIVSLSHVRDLYSDCVDSKLCENLIDLYDKSSRQLYNLATRWRDFRERYFSKKEIRHPVTRLIFS